MISVESVSNPDLSIIGLRTSDPCFGTKFIDEYKQGRVTFIEDIYTSNLSLCHLEFLSSLKVIANLVIPILSNDSLYGLLIAHSCSKSRRWQQEEIEFLQELLQVRFKK